MRSRQVGQIQPSYLAHPSPSPTPVYARVALATAAHGLTASHPASLGPCSQNGMLPLHIALQYKAPDVVVLAVLAAHPEAIKEKDNVRRATARTRISYNPP